MKKTILHLDMDSYFAGVEQLDNLRLRNKPVGVVPKLDSKTACPAKLQRSGVVAAASIEAKKFGVKSGMSTWQAKKLCPQIILVPARFQRYQELSRRVFSILENYSPLLEIFSIDEAFLDISHRKDDPVLLSLEIKARLRKEIGDYLSCSIGLAPNKLLAKLASGLEKPDGLVVLMEPSKIQETLEKITLDELCGIGPKVLKRLNQLGIYATSQLANFDENILRREFGIYGSTLKQMGRGGDLTGSTSEVLPYYEMPEEKSMGHMYTLPADIYTLDEAKKVLYKLCEQVGERLRQKQMAGKTVTVTLRFNDFSHFRKQYSLPRYINSGSEIYKTTCLIINSLKPNTCNLKPIRMVGVSVSNLIHPPAGGQNRQLSLLKIDQKQERLAKQIDKINQKFGEFTVAPVPAFQTHLFYTPDGRTKRFYNI